MMRYRFNFTVNYGKLMIAVLVLNTLVDASSPSLLSTACLRPLLDEGSHI